MNRPGQNYTANCHTPHKPSNTGPAFVPTRELRAPLQYRIPWKYCGNYALLGPQSTQAQEMRFPRPGWGLPRVLAFPESGREVNVWLWVSHRGALWLPLFVRLSNG